MTSYLTEQNYGYYLWTLKKVGDVVRTRRAFPTNFLSSQCSSASGPLSHCGELVICAQKTGLAEVVGAWSGDRQLHDFFAEKAAKFCT